MRLNRKSPVLKSETSKQISGLAAFLMRAFVAALVAVASNKGPGGSRGGLGRINSSGADVGKGTATAGITVEAVPT